MLDDSTAERRKQVEERLSHAGLSIRSWAAANGFSPSMVHAVIAGRVSCRFGKSHQIAVLLGLKDGELAGRQAEIRTHRSSASADGSTGGPPGPDNTTFSAKGCASIDGDAPECTTPGKRHQTGE